KFLTMVARNVAIAGSTLAPEKLHSRTATLPASFTRIIPISPVSSPAGHPAATASPVAAPGTLNVCSAAQPLFGIAGKSSTALPVVYVGTVAVSTPTTVCPLVSEIAIPAPLFSTFAPSHARWSLPPLASQTPPSAVQVKTGITSAGNAVIPVTAAHPDEHVRLTLCPTVITPPGEMYMYAIPSPLVSVAVALFLMLYTVPPKRTLHGVAAEHP